METGCSSGRFPLLYLSLDLSFDKEGALCLVENALDCLDFCSRKHIRPCLYTHFEVV